MTSLVEIINPSEINQLFDETIAPNLLGDEAEKKMGKSIFRSAFFLGFSGFSPSGFEEMSMAEMVDHETWFAGMSYGKQYSETLQRKKEEERMLREYVMLSKAFFNFILVVKFFFIAFVAFSFFLLVVKDMSLAIMIPTLIVTGILFYVATKQEFKITQRLQNMLFLEP